MPKLSGIVACHFDRKEGPCEINDGGKPPDYPEPWPAVSIFALAAATALIEREPSKSALPKQLFAVGFGASYIELTNACLSCVSTFSLPHPELQLVWRISL